MQYQKIINLLDNTLKQPPKFITKNWVEINDESRGMYSVDMVNGDLARSTTSKKVLRDKAFNMAKNPKYDGYQRSLAFNGL